VALSSGHRDAVCAISLSDRQAADAVRSRIDFKYALGLELTDAGFDHTVLSEFRTRLVAGNSEQVLLDTMLTLFKERGWLKARGKQRTDSTHVLAKIRPLNRVLCVGETLRHALNCLAIVAPEWLRAHSQPEWIEGTIRWRSSEDIPPAARYIGSPYDVEAHYSKKRSTTWVGYKVHLTETCEKDGPHLITHVETTSAPVSDDARTAFIHEGLKRKDLLPEQHIVDTGYVDAKLLLESQQDYQIDLVGPTRRNHQWQANQQKGFDADHFLIDWDHQQATCPEGHTSSSWTPAIDNRTNEVIEIKFSRHRLSSLSQPETLHAIAAPCAPHRHDPTKGTVRGFAGQATARNNQGFQSALCDACRGRRDYFAGGSHNGITPLALHWARAHASPTCGDSGSYQTTKRLE
jgi:transposase